MMPAILYFQNINRLATNFLCNKKLIQRNNLVRNTFTKLYMTIICFKDVITECVWCVCYGACVELRGQICGVVALYS